MVDAAQIEAIERATLAAVAPEEVLEIEGWLVGLDPGSIRRAASAVPLRHDLSVDPAVFDRIEAAYAERGGMPKEDARLWAASCVASSIPEAVGILKYHVDRARGRQAKLIEYKGDDRPGSR